MLSLQKLLEQKKALQESAIATEPQKLYPQEGLTKEHPEGHSEKLYPEKPPEKKPFRSLKEILEAKKLARVRDSPEFCSDSPEVFSHEEEVFSHEKETFSLSIVLNKEQLAAKEMALAGKSFAITGPAGSGKTATQRDIAATLLESGLLKETYFKPQGFSDYVAAPSIAFVAYTRRASANLARAIHKDENLKEVFSFNIMTVHALLEFQPVFFFDENKNKDSMKFEPRRNAANPLSITHLVIEEASMLGLDLWEQLYDALPSGVQIIFIGDINQLQPVGKPSIMNYALTSLPVIELKTIYRQAEGSAIIENAHRVLRGLMPIPSGEEFISLETGEKEIMPRGFSIMAGKAPIQIGQHKLSLVLGKEVFKRLWLTGEYDPLEDIILSPWNKRELGTDNMNRWISQFLGEARKAVVHEVITGFTKNYLAVGDAVMFNKQDGVIKEIKKNAAYWGKPTLEASINLTRFGVYVKSAEEQKDSLENTENEDSSLEDILLGYNDFSIDDLLNSEKEEERKKQASHIVDIELATGEIVTLSSAGEFAPQVFSLGYALTVHKAQGCEWRKVFFILHKDQAVSLNRELLYTGITRAREEVVLISKPAIIEKCLSAQRLKGDSVQEKIEFFNAKVDLDLAVACTK